MRPFNITTPDGETLYAWHVLPLSVYDQYESELLQEAQDDEGQTKPYEDSFAFKLLTEDPSSQVIISCLYTPSLLASDC